MAKIDRFRVQVYGLRPFEDDQRTTFSLPGDPYQDSPAGEAAREHLKSLGVVFYRDQFHGEGVLIQPDDGGDLLEDRVGFLAFKNSATLETDNKTFIRIAGWPKPRPKYVKAKGDDRCWHIWNQQQFIRELTPTRITAG